VRGGGVTGRQWDSVCSAVAPLVGSALFLRFFSIVIYSLLSYKYKIIYLRVACACGAPGPGPGVCICFNRCLQFCACARQPQLADSCSSSPLNSHLVQRLRRACLEPAPQLGKDGSTSTTVYSMPARLSLCMTPFGCRKVSGGYRNSLSCGKALSSEMSQPRFMKVVERMRKSSASLPLRAYRAAMSSSDVAEQQASWDRGDGGWGVG